MKILTQLTATAAKGQLDESRGIVQSVYDETTPGFIRRVNLGGAGLFIQAGRNMVAIPLAELFKLAETVEPAIKAPIEVQS